jgi:hypothetical protein
MKLDRRFLLRGTCQGALAVIGMPFLDCFLDSKGQALAATGKAIPTRFGTFFWGCGLTKALYLPKSTGSNYDDTPQLASLKPFKRKFNLFSGFRAYVDDKPNIQHWSGNAAITTGTAPANDTQFDGKTLDQHQLGAPTDANGQFTDTPLGACSSLPFSKNLTATQNIQVQFNGKNYSVRTNNWTESDPGGANGFGHGSLTNGNDVSVSR